MDFLHTHKKMNPKIDANIFEYLKLVEIFHSQILFGRIEEKIEHIPRKISNEICQMFHHRFHVLSFP